MLIECPNCMSRVDMKVDGQSLSDTSSEDPYHVRLGVGKCPSCGEQLVGREEETEHPDEGGTIWLRAERVWPKPKKSLGRKVPTIVATSLEEADLCFSGGAFTACAVMCARAIEGICVHEKTKSTTLATGLKELLDKEVIDKRLFTWGDELRKLRNLGAHATGEEVDRPDAADALAFAHAITDYVFVLTAQFKDFMDRRPKPKKRP